MIRAITAVGLVTLILGLAAARTANAYAVGPSLPLTKLFEQADFVCKAVVVSSKPAADPWFEKVGGFEPHATELQIVTVYKGDAKLQRVTFRHYAMLKPGNVGPFMPQHYEFEEGRPYIVFTSKTDDDKVFRQMWKNHKSQEDQGQFLAGNEHPNPGTIKDVVLLELSKLLSSPNVEDVKYSIKTLNTLSRADGDKAPDFSRNEVMGKLLPLLHHEDDTIATDTISTLGSRNPYLRDDNSSAADWLASIGGRIRRYSSWPNRDNETGRQFCMHLAGVVESDAPVERRALALRAMGLAREPKIIPLLKECLQSDEPLIVQAATVLLADYPYQFELDEIKVLATDARPLVRRGAAQVIGFGQIRPLVPVLDTLLKDDDPLVVQAAALSILSFSLDDSRKVLENHAKHAVFARLFVNALAHESPGLYLDELCQSVRTDAAPKGWWGGYLVWGESWDILYEYVRDFPADLPAATRDKLLDALESPASGNKEGTRYYSSSEPRDLYAMYIQKRMKDRAQAFRAQCKKGISYDMEQYFNKVDANPSHYRRESRFR